VTALDSAPFRLAALAAKRFPEGEALDAYLDGDAGLADYLRCGEPGCPWGVEPGSTYCGPHKVGRQRAQQRAYKARGGATGRPDCCEGRLCPQHSAARAARRGYRNSWAAGARGTRRIEWLYRLFGQDDHSWGVRDIAGRLDWSDDGHNDRLRGTRTAYPDLRGGHAQQWFASHPGWINHPLPPTPAWAAGRQRAPASRVRPGLDRLAEIRQVRRVNGYWPWPGENVRLRVRDLCDGAT
jgi:hypothetical protein